MHLQSIKLGAALSAALLLSLPLPPLLLPLLVLIMMSSGNIFASETVVCVELPDYTRGRVTRRDVDDYHVGTAAHRLLVTAIHVRSNLVIATFSKVSVQVSLSPANL